MNAYLLAAGYATRMYPLTRDRAKPLLEVGGRAILGHVLDRVLGLEGLEEVVVVSNARFADDFRRWADAERCPVPLRVLDDGSRSEDDKRGAVGDIAFALEQVPVDGEPWLVVAGDNLLGFDLAPIARAFRASGRPTLCLRRVVRDGGPSAYNEVRLAAPPDADGVAEVVGFREKPTDARSEWAAIALYLFPARVAVEVERYLAEGGNPDAPGHFIAWLVDRTACQGVVFDGAWRDVGSLEGLERARAEW